MNLGKLVVKLALGISLASAPIYGCGSEGDSESVSCIMDSQCKGERLCVDGYCQVAGGSNSEEYDCETFCQWVMDECLIPGNDYQSNVSKCIKECKEDASTYDATTCFSCVKSYEGTQKERCEAFKQCIDDLCGDFT